MIVVSLGANLGRGRSTVRETLESALAALEGRGCRVMSRSRWYRGAPMPASAQPDYVNGAALVDTDLDPWAMLEQLHAIEAVFGRLRGERWAARTLDLDLVDFRGFITFNGWPGGRSGALHEGELCLPHPRAHQRAFVLRPLLEIAPRWRHPVFGLEGAELLRRNALAQRCEPMTEGPRSQT